MSRDMTPCEIYEMNKWNEKEGHPYGLEFAKGLRYTFGDNVFDFMTDEEYEELKEFRPLSDIGLDIALGFIRGTNELEKGEIVWLNESVKKILDGQGNPANIVFKWFTGELTNNYRSEENDKALIKAVKNLFDYKKTDDHHSSVLISHTLRYRQ